MYLFYFMWWQLCTMEAVVATLRIFNIEVVWVSDSFCDIILVEFWNSSCIPGPRMCICTDNVSNQEVFQMSFRQFVWEAKYETLHTQLLEKECNENSVEVQYILLLCNSVFRNVMFPSMLQFIIFLGTVSEVLKVLTIYNAVWVRTLYSLVHIYEWFGGSLGVYIHRQS